MTMIQHAKSLHPRGGTSKRAAPATYAVENAEVARIFREIADLLEIQDANTFRVRAYRNAARTVEELSEPVATIVCDDPKRLTELPGIGADLAGKISEIVRTGTLGALRELEHKCPRGAVEIMRVRGLGPKRARILCDKLHVASKSDLLRAAKAGRIHDLKGFGEKTEQLILHELTIPGDNEGRMLRSVAEQYGQSVLRHVRALPGVSQAEIAGSYRRGKETVGDLDVLVCCESGVSLVEHFLGFPEIGEVLAQGPTKVTVRLKCGLQVDVRVVPQRSYGAALYYFTGSKAHNITVRRVGQQRGLKINEYGVFRGACQVGGASEEEVFASVGLPWIPPELREDRGEIEAAREGKLPRLIEQRDIRGDLQCHTTDSDGRDSLEAMAEAAEALGYEYLAITDHTPALRMVQGLDAAGFRRQARRIDRLNVRHRKLTILKGAEVDILPDGSLDLPLGELERFDIVLVAMHSKLDLPGPKQTQRLLRALRQPGVDLLAHPTGRLIGRRRAATFDFDEVCRVAREQGVMVEIDAQPDRLDFDDVSIRAAVSKGLRVAINTDAHSASEFGLIRWGISQARRGWIEAEHVANTYPLRKLIRVLHQGRR
jgi:DNA polymerase (family 10)